MEAALHRTFSAMDFEILQEAARTGARCGSTACVALQIGGDLYVAHAGDASKYGPQSQIQPSLENFEVHAVLHCSACRPSASALVPPISDR